MRSWMLALLLVSGCAAFDEPPPDGDETESAPRDAGSSEDSGRGVREEQGDDDPANVGAAGSAGTPGDNQAPGGPQPLDAGSSAPGSPSPPDAGGSVPTPPGPTPPETCGTFALERDVPSCDFDLHAPIEAGTECTNLVTVGGSAIACNGEDGWELVNPTRIRLNGAACVAVLSDATTQVVMFAGCADPPL